MVTRFLRTLIWLVSAAAAVAFAVVVFRRLGGPIAPTPVESALLDYVQRLVEHRPLYVEPSIPAPPLVMPGLPAALYPLAVTLGLQLWSLRLLSVASILLTAGVVMVIIRAETKSWTFAAAGAGLVLAGCAFIVGQPEIARPELLMLLLALAGFAAVRHMPGNLGALLAALLFTAGCLVHPMGVRFLVAAMIYIAIDDAPHLVVTVFAVVLFAGGGYLALSRVLGPWFNYVAWDLPLHSLRFEPAALLHFLGTQLLGTFGVLTLATVLTFALPAPPWRGARGLWMFMGFAMLGAGLIATQGAPVGPELLLPGLVVLALLGPISLERVTRHLAAWPGSSRVEGHGVALAALALQFLVFSASVPGTLANAARPGTNTAEVSAPPASLTVDTPADPVDTASTGP